MAGLWQQSQEGATKKMTRQTVCTQMQQNSLKIVLPIHVINTQTLHIQALINTMNLSISCQRLAGQVAHFLPNWEVLTQDQWVLQTVAGYQLELTTTPYQAHVPHQIRCSPENKVQITTEVQELLDKGAILETQLTPQNFVSQIFLVEKKGGGQRPVINLKGLNQFVKTEHFKMEGLHLLPDLLQPQDWMVKMDLKDAYLQIPIHPDHQHLLTFQWEEKTYMFQCLPFGLSAAPRVFTKLLKPVVGFLRQNGCRLIIYLDDMLLLHQDRDQLQQVTQLTCQLLESLGLMVNLKKSILTPTQELEFLGFHLCSVTMRLSIPSEKLRKIQQDAWHLRDRESVSVREIARFVGKATATMRAIPLAPLHYRALQLLMNSVLPLNYTQEKISTKYETVVTLTPASKKDLEWWIDLKKAPLGAPVYHPDPTITIHSDASNKGWGAVLNGQSQTGGLWSPEEATHNINYLELLAAFLAIKAFGKAWQNVTILLRLDNVTAVSYINQKGGTVSQLLCQLALTIWTWRVERNITLLAEHLPGHLNIQADEKSRTAKDRCNWMLNQSIFQRINSVMGPLEMDLLASRLTKQLPRFYSWRPDPEAEATDAFMQNWAAYRGFANPPWCLIHRCLTKLKKQTARMVFITPLWKTQPWCPLLLELLEDLPRRTPHQPDLVVMPQGQEFLMQQGVPQLVTWPISGNPIHHEVFLRRLQTSCLHHGETKLTPTMAPHSLSGLAGVSRGVEIPFQDL